MALVAVAVNATVPLPSTLTFAATDKFAGKSTATLSAPAFLQLMNKK